MLIELAKKASGICSNLCRSAARYRKLVLGYAEEICMQANNGETALKWSHAQGHLAFLLKKMKYKQNKATKRNQRKIFTATELNKFL